MNIAPWSIPYLLPIVLFLYVCVTRKKPLMNPLLLGGCFLFAVFMAEDEIGRSHSVLYLFSLHTACSLAYWVGGGAGWRFGKAAANGATQYEYLPANPNLWRHLALGAILISAFSFATLYDGSLQTLWAMRNRPELAIGSVESHMDGFHRLSQFLRPFGAALTVLTVLFWCRYGKKGAVNLLLLGALGGSLLIALGTGSRMAVLFLILQCTFAVWAVRERSGKTSMVAVLVLLSLIPIGGAVAVTQTLFRDKGLPVEGWSAELKHRFGSAGTSLLRDLNFNGEVDFVISTYPDYYPYTMGESLLVPLISVIPRQWWPEKPVTWGRQLAWQKGYGYSTTVTLAATLPGEGYANFGLCGWILFPLVLGAGIGYCSHHLTNPRRDADLLTGLAGVFLALSIRGDVHSVLTSSILPYFTVMIAVRYLFMKRVRLCYFRPVRIVDATVPGLVRGEVNHDGDHSLSGGGTLGGCLFRAAVLPPMNLRKENDLRWQWPDGSES